MKRILIYIACFQIVIFFAGCKKDIMEYNGREGVYFAVQHGSPTRAEDSWPYQPYSDVDFVRLGGDAAEIALKVMITGPVKDYDRSFGVEVNPDSTTGVLGQHYEALQETWTVPAGAISTLVKIRLKRTGDLQLANRTVGLRLVPSKDLALSFPEWDAIPALSGGTIVPEFDASLHTLRVNDVMVRPAVWSGTANASNVETGPFGFFTRKKMEFMIQNLGLTYADFSSAATMPQARINLLSNDGAAILTRLYRAGTPILEDDGRLMFMGNVTWRSTIGVPWVPGS